MTEEVRPSVTRLAALVAAGALIVAACGGGNSGTSGSPAASAPAESASASAGSESPGESPSGSASGFQFEQLGGAVSVVGSWSGSEQDSFLAMVKPWEEGTGAKVNYTGSRDLSAQLTAGIAAGNLPDLAGLPGPGLMKEWYDQGALKPLDFVDLNTYASSTPAGFADLGKADDGKLIGIFTKAAVKGLIYYATKTFPEAPSAATWDELNQVAASKATGDTKEWCIGLESGAASGWPGTDWLEDIVLRQSGPDVYDAWVKGEQKWTSPEIKQAFQTFGEALNNAHGGTKYVVNTNFGKAANPMFDDPPGCLFHHQASFITDFFKNEAGAKDGDFDFIPFPDINTQFAGSVTGGGDLFGMFNDTPQARSLVQWLLTPEAQQIWVERGGFISGNKNVPLDKYPDAASKKAAEILQNAQTFRFDASDQFPGAMNDAFFQAVVKFAQDQSQLDSILQSLDQTQADAYGG
ncbi:MAG TPA: ABC transporter substrate-binding protein [Candidatus Limnocylindrales bacterium]|nr:ABC transporter substrate-binding protein [Candidatus Limnocylindrales bacterium]